MAVAVYWQSPCHDGRNESATMSSGGVFQKYSVAISIPVMLVWVDRRFAGPARGNADGDLSQNRERSA